MENKKYLVVLGGPTAVGKSEMAIQLAEKWDAEIFSADSRQLYRGLDIGTAKVDKQDLSKVKHHFIDTLDISEKYSVGQYERDAILQLTHYFKKKKIAILCGGTGLYIKAVIHGLDEFPDVDEQTIRTLNTKLSHDGIGSIQAELKEKDPEYASIVDLNNPHRLIRALSVIRTSGKTFSSFIKNSKKVRPFTSILVNLTMDREKLYQKINRRVDEMVKNGLIDEVKKYQNYRQNNALQTVGYKEIFEYLDGKISLEEAISEIQKNTRRYAKRQMTWFRNQGNWKSFQADQFEKLNDYIRAVINNE